MNKIGLIVFALGAVCANGAKLGSFQSLEDAGNRIVGGDDATEGQFSHMVSLRDVEMHGHVCGGSILTNRFILTAEHCTRHSKPADMYAVVGSIRLTEGGTVIRLDKITPHENQTHLGHNDICLIHTLDEIVFSDTVQPIALPTEYIGGDIRVVLAGWGMLGISQVVLSDVLQFIESRTITNDACRKRMEGERSIYDEHVCTTNPYGIGACYGDSGSGLIDISNPNKKILVGIVVFGNGCAEGYPDVFERTFYFLNWIKTKMAEQSQSV